MGERLTWRAPEAFPNLYLGFDVALSLKNLMYCFIGVFAGTMIGVLPGIGPLATIAMLLPITFNLEPTSALIMLAGIYYGCQYGGSTTAILVKLPGESASVVTCLDGHEMARNGRAGPALAIAAIASFIAGTVGTSSSRGSARRSPSSRSSLGARIFSLMVMGLIASAVLAPGSVLKAIAMIFLGLLFGIVGTDVNSGMSRFAFGFPELTDGLTFTVVAMGLFGFAEILSNLDKGPKQNRDLLTKKIDHLYPTKDDMRRSATPIVRGTALGAFFGALPGAGPTIAAFSSYALEKKLTKRPSSSGKGDRRRGGTGIGEQRGGPVRVHSDACARHTGQRDDGAHARRADDSGDRAGAAGDDSTSRAFLGPYRQHVDRQPHACRAQPAACRPVGAAAAGAYRLLFPAILTFMAIGVYSINNSHSTCT